MVDGTQFAGKVQGEGGLAHAGAAGEDIQGAVAETAVQGFVQFPKARGQGVRTAFVGRQIFGVGGCYCLGATGGAVAGLGGSSACGVVFG